MKDQFNPARIIARKRDGCALSADEIAAFVDGYCQGRIPDYQMSALAMAVYLCGMNVEETAALTRQMLLSGVTLHWDDTGRPKVDKHSTGGVGDKVSLVLAPMLACCGVDVPMISGRGLGPTGGTLDKLESIPGFRTKLSLSEIQRITQRVGCVITAATEELVPADRKLYALRDVTGTVASIPLITASIMSKKLAESLSALVLDVKFGTGAFMKSLDQARELARNLVHVGQRMGVPTSALLTDMNQPLGRMVGGAVEVNESVDVLRGDGPADVLELALTLGSELLAMVGLADTRSGAREQLAKTVSSGSAVEKFAEMAAAQGGDLEAPRAVAPVTVVKSLRSGFVGSIDAARIGWSIIDLGGGRKVMNDTIDPSAGLEMLVRVGDPVDTGQPLMNVFASPGAVDHVRSSLLEAIHVGEESPRPRPLIAERIPSHGEIV